MYVSGFVTSLVMKPVSKLVGISVSLCCHLVWHASLAKQETAIEEKIQRYSDRVSVLKGPVCKS